MSIAEVIKEDKKPYNPDLYLGILIGFIMGTLFGAVLMLVIGVL